MKRCKNRVKDGRGQFNLTPTEPGHQEALQTEGQGFQCTRCLGPDGPKHRADMGLYTLKRLLLRYVNLISNKTKWGCEEPVGRAVCGSKHMGLGTKELQEGLGNMPFEVVFR